MKKELENPSKKLITYWNPACFISESFRTLRTNIQFASIGKEVRSILVTSTLPGEGKTTIAANLAVVMGQAGKKTVFVDGDLRRPNGCRTFCVNNRVGITSYLVGKASLNDIIQESEVPNVSVIASGPIPPNPAELLGSEEISQLIEEIKLRFDMVIVNSAPALAIADPVVLSTYVDGCILVIHSGKTNEDLIKKVIEQLKMVNAKILGVVLNKLSRKNKKEEDYYYYQSKQPMMEKEIKHITKERKTLELEETNKSKETVEIFKKKIKKKSKRIKK